MHDSIEHPGDSFQALFLRGADYCKREEERKKITQYQSRLRYPPQPSVISCCSSQTCWIGNLTPFIGERPARRTSLATTSPRPTGEAAAPREPARASPGRDAGSRPQRKRKRKRIGLGIFDNQVIVLCCTSVYPPGPANEFCTVFSFGWQWQWQWQLPTPSSRKHRLSCLPCPSQNSRLLDRRGSSFFTSSSSRLSITSGTTFDRMHLCARTNKEHIERQCEPMNLCHHVRYYRIYHYCARRKFHVDAVGTIERLSVISGPPPSTQASSYRHCYPKSH